MKPKDLPVPVAYSTPREWLEGKRRFVEALRRFCRVGDRWPERRQAPDRDVLEAALNWCEDQHLVRMSQTRAAGITLPVDEFAAAYELDDVEREIVELLLVDATDLTRDNGRGLSPNELVRLLTRDSEAEAHEYLPYFLHGSRLHEVVNFHDALGRTRLGLDDDLVATLVGADEQRSERPTAPGITGKTRDISPISRLSTIRGSALTFVILQPVSDLPN